MYSIDREFPNKNSIIAFLKACCKHFLLLALPISLSVLISATNSSASSLDKIILQAEKGSSEAQVDLARAYLRGKSTKQDYEKSYFWYKKAAEQGNPTGQTGLGWLFEKGKGVKQDYAQARFWYQKAADQGYARGQRPLGVLYELGLGVEKDPSKAASWYRKAAEQGLDRAQVNLGILYETGFGVEKDMEQAVFWYKKSTIKHYARGQTRLGLMYEQGFGVEKNIELAKSWYSKAAVQGYLKAQRLLKRLEEPKTTSDKNDSKSSKVEPITVSSESKNVGSDDQPSPATETFLYVNEDTVLVKKDPASPPPFIIKVTKGTRVIEKDRQGDWVSVVVADTGRGGWILSSQLEKRTKSGSGN